MPYDPMTESHPILRRASERGQANHGWLQSAHSFSFASYHDPEWMGFEALRVINDDRVAAGAGFPMHPHADFEIFSYVLSGQLEHRDSMGNGSVVKAGGVQYMTAGTGVRHSEFNPSKDEEVRFLQIWLEPATRGAKPRYETSDIPRADKEGKLKLFIAQDGRDGAIKTLAPADIYTSVLRDGDDVHFELREGRSAYLHVAEGEALVNGQLLKRGDAMAITDPGRIDLSSRNEGEVLLFDLEKRRS